MNLNKGDLYFIGERDLLTGSVSTYYKIGLVKESREGDAEDRLGEHQTGNPRRLFVHDVVTAEAVSDLEATVHDLHATSRISGEWFDFGTDGPDPAVAVAKDLAADQAEHVCAMRRAHELKDVPSKDEVRTPTDEDLVWYRQAAAAKGAAKRVSDLMIASTKILRDEQDREDIGRFLAVIERAPRPKFDKTAFKKAHPEIYAAFEIDKDAFRQSFNVKVPKQVAEEIELDPELLDAAAVFEATIERAAKDAQALEALHLGHLGLLRFEAAAKWNSEIATANLKAACGDAAGIGALLTWKRGVSTTKVFDAQAFGEAHPDLLEAFTFEERQTACKVLPMRGYAPSM